MPKITSRFPRSLKRLKCKPSVNYQCGGKCQPLKNNCKKMALGMAKNGLEYLKAVEDRKTRIAAVNAKRGDRRQYAVDDLGNVSRGVTGREADPNKRVYKGAGTAIDKTGFWLMDENFDRSRFPDFDMPDGAKNDAAIAKKFYSDLVRKYDPSNGGSPEQVANARKLYDQLLVLIELGGGDKKLSQSRKTEPQSSIPKLSVDPSKDKKGFWLMDENFDRSRFTDFDLPDNATRDAAVAKKVYLDLSRKYHPDAGGSDEQMANVRKLYDQMSALVEMNKPTKPSSKKPKYDNGLRIKDVSTSDTKTSSKSKLRPGAKFLAEAGLSPRIQERDGMKAIANALDTKTKLDTGSYEIGQRGSGSTHLGELDIIRLNKPSKQYPMGSASVADSTGDRQVLDMGRLIDGVERQMLAKKAIAIGMPKDRIGRMDNTALKKAIEKESPVSDVDKAIAPLEELAKLRVDGGSASPQVRSDKTQGQQLLDYIAGKTKTKPKGIRMKEGEMIISDKKTAGITEPEWKRESWIGPSYVTSFESAQNGASILKKKGKVPVITGTAKAGFSVYTREQLKPPTKQGIVEAETKSLQEIDNAINQFKNHTKQADKISSEYNDLKFSPKLDELSRGTEVFAPQYNRESNSYDYKPAVVTGVPQKGQEVSYRFADGKTGKTYYGQLRNKDYDPVRSSEISKKRVEHGANYDDLYQKSRSSESALSSLDSFIEEFGYHSRGFSDEDMAIKLMLTKGTGNFAEAADYIEKFMIGKAYGYTAKQDRTSSTWKDKYQKIDDRLTDIAKLLREWDKSPDAVPTRVIELYSGDKPANFSEPLNAIKSHRQRLSKMRQISRRYKR